MFGIIPVNIQAQGGHGPTDMVDITNKAGWASGEPMPTISRARRWGGRLSGLAVAVLCLLLWAVARQVEPDARGIGSHEQLGLAACGFYERTGYPCPTCGMTTAFAHVARGRVIEAFITQPAGAVGAVGCLAGAVGGMYVALGGRRLFRWWQVVKVQTVVMAAVAVLVLGWVWTYVVMALRAQ